MKAAPCTWGTHRKNRDPAPSLSCPFPPWGYPQPGNAYDYPLAAPGAAWLQSILQYTEQCVEAHQRESRCSVLSSRYRKPIARQRCHGCHKSVPLRSARPSLASSRKVQYPLWPWPRVHPATRLGTRPGLLLLEPEPNRQGCQIAACSQGTARPYRRNDVLIYHIY